MFITPDDPMPFQLSRQVSHYVAVTEVTYYINSAKFNSF